MDGLQDLVKLEGRGVTQRTAQCGDRDKALRAQVSSAAAGGDTVEKACADYEAALAECYARIAQREGETAEDAEGSRAEIDELCQRGDEGRVGLASARWGEKRQGDPRASCRSRQ